MRNTTVAIRTTGEIKGKLQELVELMSAQMGTRISQTQAVEIAISEALASRVPSGNNA